MKNLSKKLLSVSLAAAAAFSLAACSTEVAESSFDNPLPWHSAVQSYEKLSYAVAVYNTQKSEKEDEREKIADGTMTFTLEEGKEDGTTMLVTDFSVTYSDTELAGEDRGLTDTITSTVYFEPNSLTVSSMQKTVLLADREGSDNLSYIITADYFGTHKATFKYIKQNTKEKTMSLPRDAVRDNEMMFFVARAQKIGKGSSTNFKMINLFDTFNYGETTEYTIAVTGGAERSIDIGDWVKGFGIAADKDDSAKYPVKCITTTLAINAENHGPSYTVKYALDSFKQGDEEHKKIPLAIDYSTFSGSNPYRHISYTLSDCTFKK